MFQRWPCKRITGAKGARLQWVLSSQVGHFPLTFGCFLLIAVLGTSIGGVIFPIMLNQLFKSSVGFEWGVRATAFLCLGILAISNVLMSTNPVVLGEKKAKPNVKEILTDVPYLFACFGYVNSIEP
jgi:hypothetical protein